MCPSPGVGEGWGTSEREEEIVVHWPEESLSSQVDPSSDSPAPFKLGGHWRGQGAGGGTETRT